MNTFKQQLEKDQAVFFNLDEFAEQKRINGKVCTVVVDDNVMNERSDRWMDREGFGRGQVTLFIRESELGYRPRVDDKWGFGEVDGAEYPHFVTHVACCMGILEITLEANR